MNSVARRMFELVEPIGVIPYSADEPKRGDVRPGFTSYWDTYFAGRAAPLGLAAAEVVDALFYNFAPGEVARHIPKVWRILGDRVGTAAFARAAELLIKPRHPEGWSHSRENPGRGAAPSTMVGLGPPPLAAWAAAALAGAIWLTEKGSPATARTTAISMIRILEKRIPWIKFTAVFPSCWCENLLPGTNVLASVGSLADTPVSWPGPGMYGAGAGSPRPASAGLSDGFGTLARDWGVRLLSQSAGRDLADASAHVSGGWFWHDIDVNVPR